MDQQANQRWNYSAASLAQPLGSIEPFSLRNAPSGGRAEFDDALFLSKDDLSKIALCLTPLEVAQMSGLSVEAARALLATGLRGIQQGA
jgi:hypothetical protein